MSLVFVEIHGSSIEMNGPISSRMSGIQEEMTTLKWDCNVKCRYGMLPFDSIVFLFPALCFETVTGVDGNLQFMY